MSKKHGTAFALGIIRGIFISYCTHEGFAVEADSPTRRGTSEPKKYSKNSSHLKGFKKEPIY